MTIFEVMVFKGAIVAAGGLIAAGFATWSVVYLERHRGTKYPPDVSPLPYLIGKKFRRFRLSAKRKGLK